jgi:hypothetical protein
MESTALEKMNEAILALEAEGYEFSTKILSRSITCGVDETKTKQVIELRCYKYLPADESPPEFKNLKGFLKALTC